MDRVTALTMAVTVVRRTVMRGAVVSCVFVAVMSSGGLVCGCAMHIVAGDGSGATSGCRRLSVLFTGPHVCQSPAASSRDTVDAAFRVRALVRLLCVLFSATAVTANSSFSGRRRNAPAGSGARCN